MTTDFTLRPWRDADLASLVKYAGNPRIAQFMTNAFPHPYTEQDGREFLTSLRSSSSSRLDIVQTSSDSALAPQLRLAMTVGNSGLRVVDGSDKAAVNPVLRAIDVGGEAVGSIGLFPQTDIHERNAELGYWLAEPFWGRGIMTRAVREMVSYGFATHPDVTRIFARPFSTNPASQRVLEKAGFTLEARLRDALYKNGAYMDELVFAIRR